MSDPYREAESLRVLMRQVNEAAPNRSTASDGWIGDAAHATRASDHNPWIKDPRGVGVVRARDITDDPTGGCDAGILAESIAAMLGKHPALGPGAYVIHDRRIISTNRLREDWRPYTGSNPHIKHVHVSVGLSGYDSTAPWTIRLTPAPKPTRVSRARDLLTRALTRAVADGKTKRARRLRRGLRKLPRR